MLHEIVEKISKSYFNVTSTLIDSVNCRFLLSKNNFNDFTFSFDNSIAVQYADNTIDFAIISSRADCNLIVTSNSCKSIVAILPFWARTYFGTESEFLALSPSVGYFSFVFSDSINSKNIKNTNAFVTEFTLAISGKSTNEKNDFITSQKNNALKNIVIESLRSKQITVNNVYERFLKDLNANFGERYVLYLTCTTILTTSKFA